MHCSTSTTVALDRLALYQIFYDVAGCFCSLVTDHDHTLTYMHCSTSTTVALDRLALYQIFYDVAGCFCSLVTDHDHTLIFTFSGVLMGSWWCCRLRRRLW